MGESARTSHGILLEFNKQTLPDGFVVEHCVLKPIRAPRDPL